MATIAQEMELYLTRPAREWQDHQRVLPWGDTRPSAQEIADRLGINVSTVYRWQQSQCPLPVEAAFHLAKHLGTQYLSYLAQKYHLKLEPIRTLPTKGPLVNEFAELQAEQSRVLPLLAKVDRGELLSEEEKQSLHYWRSRTIELVTAITTTATKGTRS